MLDLDDEHSVELPAKFLTYRGWVPGRIRLTFSSATPWEVALTFLDSDDRPLIIGLSRELIAEVIECTHGPETITCVHQAGIGDNVLIVNRPQRQPGYGPPVFTLEIPSWGEDDTGVTQLITDKFKLSLRSIMRFMARIQPLVPPEPSYSESPDVPDELDYELLKLLAGSI